MRQLFEMIKSLATTVNGMTAQMTTLADSVQKLANTPADGGTITEESLYTKFWEFEEQKKRRDCFIVKGTGVESNATFSDNFGDISEAIIGS